MAIKIPALERIKKTIVDQTYFFKDLHLDFEKDSNFDFSFNNKTETSDIKVSYDEVAIKNSIKNIFNTKPGQRFLFPLFGLDLYQFLFEAVNESNGQIIGETIIKAIEEYEPRIYVNTCLVQADEDNNKYEITLVIEMPDLKKTIEINTDLDLKTQSFIFIENARNK